MRLLGLAALFAAGVLLSVGLGVGGAADVTTTQFTTSVIEQTTTEPGTTVVTTATVEQTTTVERTTTRRVLVTTAGTTTSDSESASDTPTWVWVVLGILAAAVIGLVVALVTRRDRGLSPADRRRRLDHAIGTWAAQGWALQSQSSDSAVLERDGDLTLVSVDEAGQVTTRPLNR